jgi:predicted TIM-barrel fold metal-dependent hydrolase
VIVDCHTHVFDSSVGGARENFPKWPGTRWGGGAQDLLRQMGEAGIDRAFLISYTPVDVMAHYPPEVRDDRLATFQHYLTREYFVRTWQQYPDRFWWFSDSIDPRVPGYVERAAQDLDRGATGLKLLPSFVDTPIDDPGWQPIFALLRDRRKPCIIDLSYWYMIRGPWFAPRMYGKYRDYAHYAEGVHRVAEAFPDVPMQFAHYGTPALREPDDPTRTIHYDRLRGPIEMIRPHPNLYADLAAYQHFIAADEPFPYWSALRIVEILVAELGADRIIWGTDWPYLGQQPYPELIRAIREAPFLKAAEADQILGANALRLLGRRPEPVGRPV